MGKNGKPLLDLLEQEPVSRLPIWFMRQAGRYLPEYRELCSKTDSFLKLCLSPDLATEVALMPLNRFDIDAVILFSDILMVPFAFGKKVGFQGKEGTWVEPLDLEGALERLVWDVEKLEPVFESVSLLRDKKREDTTLIGFTGGLWTLACYMIEGNSHGGFARVKERVVANDPKIDALMDILMKACVEFAGRQIEAGAEVIHIFDSWAGILTGESFRRFVIDPTRRLIEALKNEYPHVPVIGFPRGASQDDYFAYVSETGVSALALDQHVSLSFAKKCLEPIKPLQGNVDPQLLWEGGDRMFAAIDDVLANFGPRHILNLGHGIFPETPPENVEAFIRHARRGEG